MVTLLADNNIEKILKMRLAPFNVGDNVISDIVRDIAGSFTPVQLNQYHVVYSDENGIPKETDIFTENDVIAYKQFEKDYPKCKLIKLKCMD